MAYRLKYCTVHDSLWDSTISSEQPEGVCKAAVFMATESYLPVTEVIEDQQDCKFIMLEAYPEGSKRL